MEIRMRTRWARAIVTVGVLAACGLVLLTTTRRAAGGENAAGAMGADPKVAAIRALIDKAQFAEAEAAAREVLAAAERSEGADSAACGSALDLLVTTLYRSGRWGGAEARDLATRAVRIKEARFGPESTEAATSLLNLGMLQNLVGPVASARSTLDRALAIREKAFGPSDLAVAEALILLAPTLVNTGDFAEGIAAGERAVAIQERLSSPDDPTLARYLSNL